MRPGGDVAERPVLVELVHPDVAVADAAHGRLALGAQLELGHARAQRLDRRPETGVDDLRGLGGEGPLVGRLHRAHRPDDRRTVLDRRPGNSAS